MSDPQAVEHLNDIDIIALYQQAAEVIDTRATEQSMDVIHAPEIIDPRFGPLMELSAQAVSRSAEITRVGKPPFWKRGFTGPIQKYVMLDVRKPEGEAKGVRRSGGMLFVPNNRLLRGFPSSVRGEIIAADPRSGFLVINRQYEPGHIPPLPTRYLVKVLGQDQEPLVAVHFLDTAQTDTPSLA